MWPFYHGHYSQYIITGFGVIRYNTAARPTRELEALTTFEAIQTFMSILANVAIKTVVEIDAIMTISITAYPYAI